MTSKLWATWPSLCTSTLNISIAERLEARHWKIRNQYSAKEDYHWDWINKLNNDYLLILTHIIELFSTQNQTPTTWKLIPRECTSRFLHIQFSIIYFMFVTWRVYSLLCSLFVGLKTTAWEAWPGELFCQFCFLELIQWGTRVFGFVLSQWFDKVGLAFSPIK